MFKMMLVMVVLLIGVSFVFADEPPIVDSGKQQKGESQKDKPKEEGKETEVTKFTIPPQRVSVGVGYDTPMFRLPVSTDSVSKELIRELKPFTLDSLFAFTPGIDVQNGGLLSEKSIINMRGMQGRYGCQRVLVLLDDVPINEEYMGDVDFRFIPSEAVEEVEVFRGPGSALYGANAMAGVIRLKTIALENLTTGVLRLTSRLASFDTEYYSAVVASPGRYRYLVTSSYARTEGYLLNSDGTPRDWEQGTGYFKFEALVSPRHIIRLSAGTVSANSNQEAFKQDTSRDYESLSFLTRVDEKEKLDFLLCVFRNGTDNLYEWKFGAQGNYYQQTLGSKANITYRYSYFRLTVGGEYTEQRADVREYNGSLDETSYTGSGFAQLFYERGNFTALLGLRHDTYSSFGGETSPRAALSYILKNGLLIRAAAGKSFRAPAISDLYLPPTSYMGMTFRGNPDLEPEYAWTYEIGFRRDTVIKQLQNPKTNTTLKTDVTFFSTDAKDFFDYILVDPATLTFEPRNITRTSINGAELQLAFSNILLPRLDLILNYAYTEAIYKRYPPNPSVEGNNVEYIPRNLGSAALSYRFTNGTRFVLYMKASDHRNTDPQNWTDNNLHSYAVLGLRFSAPLFTPEKEKQRSGSGLLFISVDNLFNKEYFETKGQPAPGRSFSAGIQVEF